MRILMIAATLALAIGPAQARHKSGHARVPMTTNWLMSIFSPSKEVAKTNTRRRTPSKGLMALFSGGAGRAAGIVRSKSGASAHVAPAAAGAFQCLIDRLDAQGYPIRFMGGYRARGSVRGSLHPTGLALDINQTARNRTRPKMPGNEVALANACGLVSGRQWHRSPDSGHFQRGGWKG